MKLQELKAAGIIPETLPDRSFLFICTNKLGIGKAGISMDYEISDSQLQKIIYSADINNYKIKNQMEIQHNSVIERYNELINNYKNMIVGIQANPNFKSEVAALTTLVTNLESERNSYKTTVAGFAAQKVGKYFDFDESKSNISEKIIETSKVLAENTQKQVNKNDSELNKLYDKLGKAEARKPKSITGKLRNALKTRSLQNKIKKLRTKNGRLQTIQRTIIESRTSSYVNKMNKRFDRYILEQDKIAEAIENKKEMLEDIGSYESEREYANNDYLEALSDKSNSKGIKKIGANIKVRSSAKYKQRMEAKIIQLQEKIGSVNISDQFSTTFARSYAR